MDSNTMTLLLLPLMVVAFYFLLIRPQRKRQQQQQRLLSEMQPGERVVTHSGIFGTLVSTGDKQSVLQIGPGVEITVLKQAIARVARPEDEDTEVDEELADEVVDESTGTPGLAATGTAGAAGVSATDPATDPDAAYDPYRPGEPSSLDLPSTADDSPAGIRDVTSSYFDRPANPFDRPDQNAERSGSAGATEAGLTEAGLTEADLTEAGATEAGATADQTETEPGRSKDA